MWRSVVHLFGGVPAKAWVAVVGLVLSGVFVAEYTRYQRAVGRIGAERDVALAYAVAQDERVAVLRGEIDSLARVEHERDTVFLARWKVRYDTLRLQVPDTGAVAAFAEAADSTVAFCTAQRLTCAARAARLEEALSLRTATVDTLIRFVQPGLPGASRGSSKPHRTPIWSALSGLGGFALGVWAGSR